MEHNNIFSDLDSVLQQDVFYTAYRFIRNTTESTDHMSAEGLPTVMM